MKFVAEQIGVAVCLVLLGEALGTTIGLALSRWGRASRSERDGRMDGRVCGSAAAIVLWPAGALPVNGILITAALAGAVLYVPLPALWRATDPWRRSRLLAAVLAGEVAATAVLDATGRVGLLLPVPHLFSVVECVGGALVGALTAFGLCESHPGQQLRRRTVPPAAARWLGSRTRRVTLGASMGLAGALGLECHRVALPPHCGAAVAGWLLLPAVTMLAARGHRATIAALITNRTHPANSVAATARTVLWAGVIGASAGALAMPSPWRWAGGAVLALALVPVSISSVRRARRAELAGGGLPVDPGAIRMIGLAIGVSGWLNGFTEPNVGGRADQIEHALHLTDLLLSFGWAGWPIAMWIASTIGGRLIERFGTRSVLLLATALYWVSFALVGTVSSWEELFGIMFLIGLGNGWFDVAWARVAPWCESQQQRSRGAGAGLANQLQNAFFSNGSAVAAVVVLAVVHSNVPILRHLAAVSVLALIVILGWAGWCLPNLKATDLTDAAPVAVLPPPRKLRERVARFRSRLGEAPWELRRAGIVVACGALPVGIGYVWASVYLARLGAQGWVITAGLLAFTTSEMLTRIAIGLLSQRFAAFRDPVRLTLIGGILGLVAILLIAAPGRIYPAIAGFGLLAAATAPLGPLVQSAAPRLWPTRKGAAAALVTRYSYTALVAGPALIGPLSTSLGAATTAVPLQIALGSLAVLFVVVIVLRKSVRAAQVASADERSIAPDGATEPE